MTNPPVGFGHRVHHYVEDMRNAVEQFQIPPVLVGHSMGGLVVQVLVGLLAGAGLVTVRAQEPDDLTALSTEVIQLYNQGKHAEAIGIAERALDLAERLYGADHLDVGQSLNNLAFLYDALGRYAEAEPLYQRALAIAERALGPDHPKVGTALNNLAMLYRAQGRYHEAEPLLRRGVLIAEKALGSDHSDVGARLGTLAALY